MPSYLQIYYTEIPVMTLGEPSENTRNHTGNPKSGERNTDRLDRTVAAQEARN